MHIQRRVFIKSPPELVWAVITDLHGAKEWAPAFADYPYVSPNWPASGATAVWRYHLGPFRVGFHLTITECVPGKALQIANRSLLGSGIEVYSFTFSGAITTLWYDVSDEPNFFGKLIVPVLEKRLRREVDATMANLKEYCERRASVRPATGA